MTDNLIIVQDRQTNPYKKNRFKTEHRHWIHTLLQGHGLESSNHQTMPQKDEAKFALESALESSGDLALCPPGSAVPDKWHRAQLSTLVMEIQTSTLFPG